MIPRKLEPEVMDTAEEAIDYDSMDHSEVNRVFVEDFLEALRKAGIRPSSLPEDRAFDIIDLGTGTALIPIELCQRNPFCQVTAVDLAGEMLKVARRNIEAARLQDRIELKQADCKKLPEPDARFYAVMSNSIIHHIPEPLTCLAEMRRVLRPGGLLFVRDLLRPDDQETLDRLVDIYAGDANAHQQQMFRDSLHAALTVNEVRELLQELDLPAEWVRQTTDRHWTISGRLPL